MLPIQATEFVPLFVREARQTKLNRRFPGAVESENTMIKITEKYHSDCMDKAFRIATMFCGGVIRYDETASENAGYEVYRNVTEYYTYLCLLGDRIEVNLHTGEVINIWIDYQYGDDDDPLFINRK